MEKQKKIRELQEDLRALDADIQALHATIQKQTVARDGLSTYLEYLQESDKDHHQEPSFPELQIPNSHRATPPTRSYVDENPSSTNGHSQKINVAREVREAVKETEGDIIQKQITQRLSEKFPDASINPAVVANSLAKMVEREQGIVLVERGSGSAPNVYRKVGEIASQENPPQGAGTYNDGYVESTDPEDGFMSG